MEGESLEVTHIRRRGVFRVICLCMISLTLVMRKSTADLAKGFKVNYLLFIGELNLFRKIKDQIDSLVKELYNCLVRTLEWSLG